MTLGASQSMATVTVQDHAVFGSGSLTIDSNQQLAFLDVNLSLGRSFNDISNEFGVGGDFEGFRYATQSEVRLLMINFGIDIQTTHIDSNGTEFANLGSDTDIFTFVNLIGVTSTSGSLTRVEGITDDVPSDEAMFTHRQFTDIRYYSDTLSADSMTMGTAWGIDIALNTVGSFLVQESIPSPSGLSVLGIGALAASRRR